MHATNNSCFFYCRCFLTLRLEFNIFFIVLLHIRLILDIHVAQTHIRENNYVQGRMREEAFRDPRARFLCASRQEEKRVDC